MAKVEIHNLTTGYISKHHKVIVTEHINASLSSGQLTCLLGPNGAGKSTLLRTLSGFQPPLAGQILIDGNPLESYSPSRLAKIIGVVLTEKVNLDNMSVTELVGMGRSPYTGFWGRMSLDDRRIVDHAINLVGIAGLKQRMVQTLSDGERQKVMIAKALAQETPIIFLDEPTAFLDYPSKVEIMQLLLRLAHEEGKTVFLSTHDLELALQIADMIWLIDKPFGLTTGVPEDLSIDGSMDRYFKREGVKFDTNTGLFRIENDYVRTVTVTGNRHDPRYRMLCKALSRCRIKPVDPKCGDTADSNISLEVTDKGYVVNGLDLYTLIADVLSTVK